VVMMPTMVPMKMANSFHALMATPAGAGMNHRMRPAATEMASAFMSAPRGAGAGVGAGAGDAGTDAVAATLRRPARATLMPCEWYRTLYVSWGVPGESAWTHVGRGYGSRYTGRRFKG
jgi:hypothetical protein